MFRHPAVSETQTGPIAHLWYGSAGSRTRPHFDFYVRLAKLFCASPPRADCRSTDCPMQENFFVQVLGEKRWLLAAPAAFGEMYVLPGGHPSGRQSALDWPHVNTTAYPRATGRSATVGKTGVGLLETWLKPKEVLYCPPVWFHSTEAVGPGPNLGLSFWSESGEQRGHRSAALPVGPRCMCVSSQRHKLAKTCFAPR